MADDAVVRHLVQDWLSEYAKLQMLDPVLAGRLAARRDDFAPVPVPRSLLRALATEDAEAVRAMRAELTALFSAAGHAPAAVPTDPPPADPPDAHSEVARTVVRAFMNGVERGDAAEAMACVAEVHGPDGRAPDRDGIRAVVDGFIAGTERRTFILLEAVAHPVGTGVLVARCRGAWSAATSAQPADFGEIVTLSLRFTRTGAGAAWQIARIATS